MRALALGVLSSLIAAFIYSDIKGVFAVGDDSIPDAAAAVQDRPLPPVSAPSPREVRKPRPAAPEPKLRAASAVTRPSAVVRRIQAVPAPPRESCGAFGEPACRESGRAKCERGLRLSRGRCCSVEEEEREQYLQRSGFGDCNADFFKEGALEKCEAYAQSSGAEMIGIARVRSKRLGDTNARSQREACTTSGKYVCETRRVYCE